MEGSNAGRIFILELDTCPNLLCQVSKPTTTYKRTCLKVNFKKESPLYYLAKPNSTTQALDNTNIKFKHQRTIRMCGEFNG